MSLVVFREVSEEIHWHNELQDGVSQEFHPLVIATEEKKHKDKSQKNRYYGLTERYSQISSYQVELDV